MAPVCPAQRTSARHHHASVASPSGPRSCPRGMCYRISRHSSQGDFRAAPPSASQSPAVIVPIPRIDVDADARGMNADSRTDVDTDAWGTNVDTRADADSHARGMNANTWGSYDWRSHVVRTLDVRSSGVPAPPGGLGRLRLKLYQPGQEHKWQRTPPNKSHHGSSSSADRKVRPRGGAPGIISNYCTVPPRSGNTFGRRHERVPLPMVRHVQASARPVPVDLREWRRPDLFLSVRRNHRALTVRCWLRSAVT
jgi:hypothetical protein